jgi:hypothetical protein
MIREATSLKSTFGASAPEPLAPDFHLGSARTRPAEAMSHELAEDEISRLTWAVLDGRATSEQRLRLAALVSTQHERRHR